MPWWNREILPHRVVEVGATPVHLLSDPEAMGDPLIADQLRSFVEVDLVESDCRIEVFRLGGADPEELEKIDSAPVAVINSEEVALVDWPEPLPAYVRLSLVVSRTSGSGTVKASLRALQTCRVGG